MEASSSPPAKSGAMRRFGPIIALVAVVAIIAAIVVVKGGKSDSGSSSTATTVATNTRAGAVSWADAQAAGTTGSINWGPRCNTETGRLMYPSYFAGQCYAPFSGDNGGTTATGVTATSIKVVFYQAQESDPVLNYITSAVKVEDTNAQVADTMKKWMEFYNYFYETYGRKVELVPFVATGASTDEVAARADANTIAEDIKPFAVFGGPILATSFGDELAARKVLCISCGPGATYDYFDKASPYLWGLTILPVQAQEHVVEYLSKQLNGANASHAGDPTLQNQKRSFGMVYISTGADSEKAMDVFEQNLKDNGVTLAARVAYKSPVDLQTDSSGVIAKLKSAGVTSVLFSGDPIAPQPLTLAATTQEYFPEWIVTGSVLVDTAAFSRTYDQKQWAHAFGVSFGAARTDPNTSGTKFLYRWFFGSEAASKQAAATSVINPGLLFPVLQGMGPNVTAQNFKDALFAASPTTHAITAPSLSDGNKGYWPQPDYVGVDDGTEVWWNPTVAGQDEIERPGVGLWEYVNGGTRYLPGEWPTEPSKAFDPTGAVTIYNPAPASEQVPNYPPCPTGCH